LTAAKLAGRALPRLADIHLLKTTSKNVSSHALCSPAALGGFWQLRQVGSVLNKLIVGTASKTKTIGKGII
jgi:hypothetical protein